MLSEPGVYDRLHGLGTRFRRILREVLQAADETVQILGDGPLAQVAFCAEPIVDHRSWLAADRARGRALMLALVRASVFLNPTGTKLYLSLALGRNPHPRRDGRWRQAALAD